MVFQYGWFDGLLGYDSLGYVNAMTPPFLLAIVFGLSMDYEVFLLSRIRERYDATGDSKRSVAEGLRASAAHDLERRADHGRGVRACSPAPARRRSRRSALGMSVAIALDATLVRLILVPATMEIMGKLELVAAAARGPRAAARRLRAGSGRGEPALDLGR